jgi:hypothetical protein
MVCKWFYRVPNRIHFQRKSYSIYPKMKFLDKNFKSKLGPKVFYSTFFWEIFWNVESKGTSHTNSVSEWGNESFVQKMSPLPYNISGDTLDLGRELLKILKFWCLTLWYKFRLKIGKWSLTALLFSNLGSRNKTACL